MYNIIKIYIDRFQKHKLGPVLTPVRSNWLLIFEGKTMWLICFANLESEGKEISYKERR
jgi:hypothetical protein